MIVCKRVGTGGKQCTVIQRKSDERGCYEEEAKAPELFVAF